MDINLNKLLKIYLIWILSLFLVFTSIFLFTQQATLSVGFIKTFESWDGGHFISISENGYTQNYQYAFFPLFPYLLKIINSVFLINSAVSSLVLNALLLFGFLKIFFDILKSQYDENVSLRIIVLFLLYPFSFFLLLPYSEALFLFLTGFFFWYIFKKNFLLASVFCSLALLTRISGLFLIPVLVFSIYKGDKKNLIFLLFPIGTIICYIFWIFNNTGSWVILLQAEKIYWGRSIGLPFMGLYAGISDIIQKPFLISNYLNLITAVFGIGLVIRSIRFLKREYVIYLLFGLSFYLCLSTLISFPRFMIVLFPIFITLEFIKNKTFLKFYILLSILLNILNIFLFISGYWVA